VRARHVTRAYHRTTTYDTSAPRLRAAARRGRAAAPAPHSGARPTSSWAQAMPTKSDEGQAMDDALTAPERRLYMIHRIVSVMTELTFGLNSACMNLKLINMSGGNMAKIATAHAWHWCCNAGLKIFTTPLFAALSDSFGRIPFWAIGRFSYFTYFLGLHLCRSLPQFSFVMVFGQCIMPSAASLTVQAAAWSDAFGSRPALSANLQARTQFWVSAGGLVGPMVGGLLATRSHSAGFFVCMGLCLFQSMIVLACEETLPPPKRKPFAGVRVAANPVRGLQLLFTHGPGLRRLALVGTCTTRCLRYPPPSPLPTPFFASPSNVTTGPAQAAVCFESTSHVYATMDTFRLGPIGFGASEQCARPGSPTSAVDLHAPAIAAAQTPTHTHTQPRPKLRVARRHGTAGLTSRRCCRGATC
jgi:hypothetical protein